jgi:hypothetical protein
VRPNTDPVFFPAKFRGEYAYVGEFLTDSLDALDDVIHPSFSLLFSNIIFMLDYQHSGQEWADPQPPGKSPHTVSNQPKLFT